LVAKRRTTARRGAWIQDRQSSGSCSCKNAKRHTTLNHQYCTVSQAYFALHKTLHEVQNFWENYFFGNEVTSEAFLSISQNLKVARLQGGTQTKLWTAWRNFDLSRSI
jgi:hypothetical protein